jgi:hypothetical protein
MESADMGPILVFDDFEKFFMHIIVLGFVAASHYIVYKQVRPYVAAERIVPRLLIEALNDHEVSQSFEEFSDETTITEPTQICRIRKIPMNVFVIDAEMNLVFLSEAAETYLGVHEAENLSTSDLDFRVVAEIRSQIGFYQWQHSTASKWIPIGPNSCLLINTYYEYRAGLSLIHLVCVEQDDSAGQGEKMQTKAEQQYYLPDSTSLPRYALRDTGLGKQSALVYVFINGFSRWTDTAPLDVISEARLELADRFEQLSPACSHSEWCDGMVLVLQSKFSPWKLNEICTSFGEMMIAAIDEIAKRHGIVGVTGTVLMNIVKDGGLASATRRNVFSDPRTDVTFDVEEEYKMCQAGIVNYTSLRREQRVPNGRKLKTAYGRNGSPFDLFAIV